MKTLKLISTVILLLCIHAVVAQTSQRGFSFQGYAVGQEGVALSEENVDVKFTVYPKVGSGYVYEETQTLTTDFYGVFSAVVGSETPELFQKMNFTAKGTEYWLKVEIKLLTEAVYSTISDEPMLAVPYARYADNGVPVGTIISFGAGATKVPEGWLICDGTQYDGTDPQYKQLYEVIGNTWGGTGTDFNVPELRGYFLRGVDNGAGTDPDAADRTALLAGGNTGDNVGSYQTDTLGVHKHGFSGSTSTNGSHSHSFTAATSFYGDSYSGTNGGDGDSNPVSSTNSAGSHSHSVTGDTDEVGTETRPKNAYVLYIIKY